MDEIEEVLTIDPFRPPGKRSKPLKDHKPLMRYRPHADNGVRILYVVEGREVWVLGLYPRSADYRDKDLRTAHRRLHRRGGRTQP